MIECHCEKAHVPRKLVLTGGPGAGKTAVLELVRQQFCRHVEVLPEAASMLFRGGFRRLTSDAARRAAQRAIFHVQRELEVVASCEGNPAIILCDRGTVDGFAYWPGPGDFWHEHGTTRAQELGRYDVVLHLRTPSRSNGYNLENPVRVESPAEAAAIDERISVAWAGHPRLFVVESSADFLAKAQRALQLLRDELPECCR